MNTHIEEYRRFDGCTDHKGSLILDPCVDNCLVNSKQRMQVVDKCEKVVTVSSAYSLIKSQPKGLLERKIEENGTSDLESDQKLETLLFGHTDMAKLGIGAFWGTNLNMY